MKESPIFIQTYDLVLWLMNVTVKFPRQHRFVLAQAVQKTVLTFQEQLIEAAQVRQPEVVLRAAGHHAGKITHLFAPMP